MLKGKILDLYPRMILVSLETRKFHFGITVYPIKCAFGTICGANYLTGWTPLNNFKFFIS